jgi:hypothetical protein
MGKNLSLCMSSYYQFFLAPIFNINLTTPDAQAVEVSRGAEAPSTGAGYLNWQNKVCSLPNVKLYGSLQLQLLWVQLRCHPYPLLLLRDRRWYTFPVNSNIGDCSCDTKMVRISYTMLTRRH